MALSITGQSVATAAEITAFIKRNNPSFDPAIAEAFVAVGNRYNIRGDVAACQSIIETGWFKFEGTAVTPDQHNYCGMGVTSNGLKGNSFSSIEEGVTAQIQHLYAYAHKEPLPPGPVLSPRFNLVTRGSANDTWEGLSGKWAMNPDYGKHITAMYDQLMATVPVKEEPVLEEEEVGELEEETVVEEFVTIKAGDMYLSDFQSREVNGFMSYRLSESMEGCYRFATDESVQKAQKIVDETGARFVKVTIKQLRVVYLTDL